MFKRFVFNYAGLTTFRVYNGAKRPTGNTSLMPAAALRFLLLLLVWCFALDAQSRAEIEQIAAQLTEITGLKLRKPIDSTTITRTQLKQFLDQQIKENVKPAEIRAEEITLKKFGLVPQTFDLRKTTVDLMTEQAAAFYDYRKKRLYLLESTAAGEMQHAALVHEVAHALADQHFKLDKYIRGASSTDDGSLARMAVMEGQATWLMSEFEVRKTGMSLAKSPATAEMMARESESASATGSYPVLDNAPLYLRESLLFPYTAGMRFQQKVIERVGTAGFAEVFRRAPSSTQQIIHPELYGKSGSPPRPPLPRLPDEKHYKGFAEGGVGEFDHAILLRQYATKADADDIAPHWRGGFYRLWEPKNIKPAPSDRTPAAGSTAPAAGTTDDSSTGFVLAYAVEWDSPAVAARYLDLYRRKILEGKWRSFAYEPLDSPAAPAPGAATTAIGRGDDGYFVLRRAGARVSSIEGLLDRDQALAAAKLDWK
jgi:hypothetical protein